MYFYYLKNIFSGSKYPYNKIFLILKTVELTITVSLQSGEGAADRNIFETTVMDALNAVESDDPNTATFKVAVCFILPVVPSLFLEVSFFQLKLKHSRKNSCNQRNVRNVIPGFLGGQTPD